MDSTEQLGKDSILMLIAKFSIPSIIAMIVSAVYNLVDRVFIGKYVGELALAGLTIVFPFMMIIFAFGGLFGIGGSALISIKFGEKDSKTAQHIYGNMLSALAICSLFLTVLGLIFLRPLLGLIGASADVLPFAEDYLSIILLGLVFQLYSFSLASLVRVEGKPQLSMLSQIIGAVTNIVLDYFFIVNLQMGVKGAALATIISQFVGLSILFYYFFVSKKSLLKFDIKQLKPDFNIIAQMSIIGASSFFMNIGNSLSSTFSNISLGRYGGDSAVAAMGVIGGLVTLVLMPIFGLQQGLGPIIGYNHGMKQHERVQRTLWTGIGLGVAFGTLVFAVLQIWPKTFASMFISPDSDTMTMCVHAIHISVLMMPIMPISVIGTAFFQSTAQGMIAFILSISRQTMFMIPAVLILPVFWGLDGVWISFPLADFLAVSLTMFFLILNRKQFVTKQKNRPLIKDFS